ncbi:MAG: hypothetical protein AMXMBFR4_03710 [Candidatus Hydrogenedentota bacterium]
MADEQPKIIIDEDWKAQVQREKEEAAKKAQEAQGTSEGKTASAPHPPEVASFAALVQTLAMQCAFALGLIAQREAKQVMVDIVEAKYMIDTLMMLRAKTKGNLTPEEEGILTTTIADLQQAYVMRSQQVQEAALKQAGIDLANPNKK